MAQTPSLIRGTVEDPSGDPIVQAVVKLTRQPAGPTVQTVTDDTGQFVFTGVVPGEYLLHIKVEGFEKAEVPLNVGTGPTAAQRVPLKIAKVAEEITVSARSGDPLSPDQNASDVQLEHDLFTSVPLRRHAWREGA
jgi:hypothetical protein